MKNTKINHPVVFLFCFFLSQTSHKRHFCISSVIPRIAWLRVHRVYFFFNSPIVAAVEIVAPFDWSGSHGFLVVDKIAWLATLSIRKHVNTLVHTYTYWCPFLSLHRLAGFVSPHLVIMQSSGSQSTAERSNRGYIYIREFDMFSYFYEPLIRVGKKNWDRRQVGKRAVVGKPEYVWKIFFSFSISKREKKEP